MPKVMTFWIGLLSISQMIFAFMYTIIVIDYDELVDKTSV